MNHLAAASTFSAILSATLALALLPRGASADDPPACSAWENEYVLSANLRLYDTPMGEGDGVYAIGPGRVVLRFDNRGGQPGGDAKMVAYRMREHFTIKAKTLVFTTTVVTDTITTATPNGCASVANGAMDKLRLQWRTPVSGYRTDGTLTCDGTLCGKFGAPPKGQSPLHIGPGPVPFAPFVFSSDMKTFTMPFTRVAKTEMPKQTADLALAGREIRRTCVQAPATCAR